MTKTKVILLMCFVMAFAAGTALGVFVIGWEHPPENASSHHGVKPTPEPRDQMAASLWQKELNLTSEQQDQMAQLRKSWAQTTEPAGRQQRSAASQQRDEAIAALLSKALTEEEQQAYKNIQQEYQQKIDQIMQARKRVADERAEQMKKILTPEQAAKFDEMRNRQRDRSHEGSAPGSRGPRSHREGSTDKPDTDRSNSSE